MQSPLRIGLSSGFVPSSNRLKTINSGQPLSQRHINNLVRNAVKTTIKPSNEYLIKQRDEGTTLRFLNKPSNLGYGVQPLTANMLATVNEKGVVTERRVFVSAGIVNMEVPKINGKYLDELDSQGKPPSILITGTGFICVKVYSDVGKPFPSRDVEIVFKSGSLDGEDTDNFGFFPIARVFQNGTTYSFTQLSRGNLVCNRVKAGQNTAIWYWNSYGF